MKLTFKQGEHITVVGQNGSGKSVLIQELIKKATVAPIFILDSKGDDGYLTLHQRGESIIIFDKGLDAFEDYVKQPPRKIADYVVIRPPLDELDSPTALDGYLSAVNLNFNAPCTFVVDELYMIHKGGRAGRGLTAWLTRGRSAEKSLIGATQRPSWVSGFCFSEPTHYYVFRLVSLEDRKKLAHLGYPVKKIYEQFHFFYYNSKQGVATDNPPLNYREQAVDSKISKQLSGWV